MNVRITLVALVLGVAAVLSSAGNASAFFGHQVVVVASRLRL